jgi:ATP-binding cassette, subfamily A (ABC1), member 3
MVNPFDNALVSLKAFFFVLISIAGLQWSNFFQPPSIDERLTVGYVSIMLLFNSVLYLLITLYVEKVFPGDYGVAEPWYFPFTQKFWCNRVQYISE